MKLRKLAAIIALFTVACFAISYVTVPKAENGKADFYPLSLLAPYKNLKLVSKISGTSDVSIDKQVSIEGAQKLNLHVESADIQIRTNDSNVVTVALKGQFTKADPLEITNNIDDVTVRVHEESVFEGANGTLQVSIPVGIRELVIATVNGQVTGELPPLRNFNVATVSGDLKFEDVDVPVVKIASVSGDIDLAGKLASLNLVSVSGDVKIHSENLTPALKINSTSGDIEVSFAGSPNAVFKFKSMSGEATFPNAKTGGPGPSSDRLVIGSGEGEVTVETISGDLSVKVNADSNSQ